MITVYRRHYCTRRHKTFLTVARCVWADAEWITGTGPVAVLAHCHMLTVTLYPSLARAEAALQGINDGLWGPLFGESSHRAAS